MCFMLIRHYRCSTVEVDSRSMFSLLKPYFTNIIMNMVMMIPCPYFHLLKFNLVNNNSTSYKMCCMWRSDRKYFLNSNKLRKLKLKLYIHIWKLLPTFAIEQLMSKCRYNFFDNSKRFPTLFRTKILQNSICVSIQLWISSNKQ